MSFSFPPKLRYAALVIFIALTYLNAAETTQVKSTKSDEAEIKQLLIGYYSAYGQPDPAEMMRYWSETSHEYVKQEKHLRGLFSTYDRFEARNIRVTQIEVDGDRAEARVLFELKSKESGNFNANFVPMNRSLQIFKGFRYWKIRLEVTTREETLAKKLIDENSEQRQLTLSTESGNLNPGVLKSLIYHASTIRVRGDYPKALSILDLIHEISQKIDHDDSEISSELMLAQSETGMVYFYQRNFDLALEYFQKSLASAIDYGDRYIEALSLIRIGNISYSLDDYDKSISYYQKALEISGEVGSRWLIATSVYDLGNGYQLISEYTKALELFLKALKLDEEMDENPVIELNGIGWLYVNQGNFDAALDFYKRSLKFAEQANDKVHTEMALSSIGHTYWNLKKPQEALPYLERAIQLSHELEDEQELARCYLYKGGVLGMLGNYQLAFENLGKSLSLSEKINIPMAIRNGYLAMGLLSASQKEYSAALNFYSEAAKIERRLSNLSSDTLTLIGYSYRKLNREKEAESAFREVIEIIENTRSLVAGGEEQQEIFFEERGVGAYEQMAEMLSLQNENFEAFTFSERARARVLSDVLASGKTNIASMLSEDEKNEELSQRKNIESLNKKLYLHQVSDKPEEKQIHELTGQLQKARQDFELFQDNLYSVHPELRIQRGRGTPLSYNEAAALVSDENTALLEYLITKEGAHLFVLTSRGSDSINLKTYDLNTTKKDLAQKVESFRTELAQRNPAFKKLAQELYRLLLEPSREQWKGKTNLIIVPDGALWELPFQSLYSPSGSYLIQEAAVSYTPSLSVLRDMRAIKAKRKFDASSPTLLAFGNPAIGKKTLERAQLVFRDSQLDQLPEAENEVRTLVRLYDSQSKVYTGSQAREDYLKNEAGIFDVVHLATHGILNDSNPMYSHLLLALDPKDSQEDGILEAREIAELNLRADLVVLSACETARGRFRSGEGIIGMTWALFVAGTPSTVVSQWKAESSSTTELMLNFHRNLRSGKNGTSKAEALRQAAISLMKDPQYSHPFYWASFIIIGEAS